MKAPKNLRKPANWQDFEKLCLVLWGEIWSCNEIQKNGRQGQNQEGVDIFGIPSGENGYYGIQCKEKNEYPKSKLTKKEILIEIENAKKFRPPLKKLYFATSASIDSKIQSLIREINIDHIKNGIFEVHYFAWESIVDLIDRNKNTYDYYVNSINFQSNRSVKIYFDNRESEINLSPKFKKTTKEYCQKIIPIREESLLYPSISQLLNFQQIFEPISAVLVTEKPQINLSFAYFKLFIENTGDEPIEELKLIFEFEGDLQEISDTNAVQNRLFFLPDIIINPNTYIWNESNTGKIIPKNKILVGDDIVMSENIYIKPLPYETTVLIKWKLISKSFKDSGVLKINFTPKIEYNYETILVENPSHVRIEEMEIEDFLVDKNEPRATDN